MATLKYLAGSIQTLMTTELNSLANAGKAIAGSGYDNSSGLYLWAAFELNVTYGTGPTVNTTVDLYLIPALDGTNYADGSSSVAPSFSCFVGGFQLRNVTTAQKIPILYVPLTPVPFKALVINNGGQTMAASANTVKMTPYYEQSV